ncbi:protein kinase family protein [Aeromicrobium piscarium]|uniref:non-specific serine/threonine protein kinase n=1 Tax=Aeromicrobium piscarium TaxID=2590901 RepID=A0A554RNK0_9ACTN|nr:protein kinase family protein [Aeromicrobium piscarium]TSD55687.1 protein kinase [Aeromicrobium piscarium]
MTSERRALTPGVVIADRYELHDLVSERLGCSNWRAHDQVLNRNVRLELLPASDPRAANFLQAARESTRVTDHHFLRVLDLIEDDDGYHGIVREWARAVPLSQVLQEAPLPNRRAVTIIAEVADAIAHAHAHGVYHRRLTPHQILLKESGAVRIVGLGVATALAPADHQISEADKAGYERADVEAIGKLLYACLVSRWPGGHTDGLRAAPTEHGRLLRPRRVRAGVARDIDTVCDRILGQPPRHHQAPLTTAADIAHVLNLVGEDDEPPLAFAGEARQSSPDLLRLDPVIEPSGPPPGLTPPRRRPKAFEPAPPTRAERGRARLRAAARGDRGLVLLGVLGTVTIVAVLALLVQQATHEGGPPLESTPTATAPTTVLPIDRALDFDPQGADRAENPQLVENALDDDAESGWYTSTYYGDPALGRLKDGVGLVLDLGRASQVEQVQLRLAGSPTDVSILTTPSTQQDPPSSLSELREVAVLDGAGEDAAIALPSDTYSRYVVVWLRSLPQVGNDEYRGEIRAVAVRGR